MLSSQHWEKRQLIKLTAADKDVFNADEILFRHSFYHRSVINLADTQRLQKLKAPDTRNLRKGIQFSPWPARCVIAVYYLMSAVTKISKSSLTHSLQVGLKNIRSRWERNFAFQIVLIWVVILHKTMTECRPVTFGSYGSHSNYDKNTILSW